MPTGLSKIKRASMLKDEDIMKRAYTLEEIASTGHSERHAKHCMQSLLINRGFSVANVMASTGQTGIQAPQPMHISWINLLLSYSLQ